ncbi:MAG TPA: DNA polymerase III subunit alpha [Bacteroidetes bacterium]|nr:DNA polymerase III subunit alpha [Bacteroidota bacterium]
MDFCHLHCHTQYSLLDGAARINRLVDKAAELEMPALAITDHGNLFGVPEFYTKTKAAGIKPIIGCEFYVTATGMSDKTDRRRFHQVLLAKNEEGYRNLIRLSSLSYTDGYYYKPRIDLPTLKEHSGGLVATTCCLQGHVLRTILDEGEVEAKKVFEQYLDIFGEDYYIEIQDHKIDDQHRCNVVLMKWAKEYNVPLVATNDVHYVEQEDSAAQDVLLCLQTGKDLYDPNRMRFENDQFYLKSASEMEAALRHADDAQVKEALSTTVSIADKCNFELPMGQLLMPHYPIPKQFNDDIDVYLKHLVYQRAKEKWGSLSVDQTERIDHELGIIAQMGYAGYFLIVQDFTTAARDLGVSVGPGRGSAAGSLAAYCLGITNVDPLKYDLLFERFLNPERVSMPDIDIDFDDRGRAKVIDYVVEKYGRENVCQIITFGTMGARSVIRDVARVLQIPLPEADRIAKMIPEGPKVSLESAIKNVPEFKKLLNDSNEQIRNLMHYAKVLEGSARHTGVHAAGVIIAPGEVIQYVPVSIAKGKGGADDIVTTQYDGKWVESFGLLKMDFLGLKTLTVIKDALDLIKQNHNLDIDPDTIPLDDERTYELFQRGDTVSIFQFESSGMREWLRKLKPTSIDDLIAMNALYRPGPMDNIPSYIARKHDREAVSYQHDMLKPILKPTFGIPVYQEQVMQMAQVMGGYTLGSADILRRAMGKKKESEMVKQRAIFVDGAAKKDVDAETANEVFDLMAKFAGYGFNKSHAAAYSIVAYQTGYLKAHYPSEFMAAAMTNEMGDTKKLAIVLEEARHLGLQLSPPDINSSSARFAVGNGKILFGLGAIKGVGLGAIEAIEKERLENGPFSSLFEFVRRVDLRSVNKKAVESLAKAGAMDKLTGHRAQIAEAVDIAIQYGQKSAANKAAGMISLFGESSGDGAAGMEPNLPVVEPWAKSRLLKEERDSVGFYVSGHPLEAFLAESRAFASAQISDAAAIVEREGPAEDSWAYRNNRPQHTFCGILTEVQHRTNKSGKPYAFAQFEDFTGQAELVCFSNTYDRVQRYLNLDEICLIKGSLEMRGGSAKVIGNDIIPMWKVREQMVKSLTVRMPSEDLALEQVEQLEALATAHRGQCKLYFDLITGDDPRPCRVLSRTVVIDPNEEVMRGLAKIFGRRAVMVEGDK